MRSYQIAVILSVHVFLFLKGVAAHVTAVCTSTATSVPGVLHLWLGTYHALNTQWSDGQLTVTSLEDGNSSSFPFTEAYNADRASRHGPCSPHALRSLNVLPADAEITCYTLDLRATRRSPTATLAIDYQSATDCPEFPDSVGSFSYAIGWMRAELRNLQTGTYTIVASDMSITMAPCDGSGASPLHASSAATHPCSLDRPHEFDLAVALAASTYCDNSCSFAGNSRCDDGGENYRYASCAWGSDCLDCKGPRISRPCPAPDVANVEPESVVGCSQTMLGGICHSVRCKDGFVPTPGGILQCNKGSPVGVWSPEFACNMRTSPALPPHLPAPKAPSPPPGTLFSSRTETGCELHFTSSGLSSNCAINYR